MLTLPAFFFQLTKSSRLTASSALFALLTTLFLLSSPFSTASAEGSSISVKDSIESEETLSEAASTAALETPRLKPFVLLLDVEKFGLRLGRAELKLTFPEENRYHFVLTTQTRGVARLLVRDVVIEVSEGIIDERGVVPLRYQYDQRGGKDQVEIVTQFDWKEGVAHTTGTEGEFEHELRRGVVDRLSIYLAAMVHLKRQEPSQLTLAIIDKTKLYDYALEPIGLDKIDSPLGSLTTLVLKRSNDRPERLSRIWMAPQFDYLPVRIRQDSKGKKDFEMNLNSLTRP
jgi:hypothetical protein